MMVLIRADCGFALFHIARFPPVGGILLCLGILRAFVTLVAAMYRGSGIPPVGGKSIRREAAYSRAVVLSSKAVLNLAALQTPALLSSLCIGACFPPVGGTFLSMWELAWCVALLGMVSCNFLHQYRAMGCLVFFCRESIPTLLFSLPVLMYLAQLLTGCHRGLRDF